MERSRSLKDFWVTLGQFQNAVTVNGMTTWCSGAASEGALKIDFRDVWELPK